MTWARLYRRLKRVGLERANPAIFWRRLSAPRWPMCLRTRRIARQEARGPHLETAHLSLGLGRQSQGFTFAARAGLRPQDEVGLGDDVGARAVDAVEQDGAHAVDGDLGVGAQIGDHDARAEIA